MQSISLQAIPNQAFAVVLDNNQWAFTLKATNGVMSVSITLNNVAILDSIRAVANGLIIPYKYLESGNFMFLTQNFQLPDYMQFGITQQLIYISAAELAVLRIPTPPPITAADFSPIAPLPLRFKPQGYTV